jgi:hypothetical protein
MAILFFRAEGLFRLMSKPEQTNGRERAAAGTEAAYSRRAFFTKEEC